jgi:gamma-glutamyltranspeptidase/glutathione hydrolase
MVSYIQSNYMGFGSGVVVPGTGIALQNRGNGFVLTSGHANQVGPGKRPFHTIIPGMVTGASPNDAIAFGVMGGPMQPQGHLQLLSHLLLAGADPQMACDAPRWQVKAGREVIVEPELATEVIDGLRARGHDVRVENDAMHFGGAQVIARLSNATYVGGSDPRKDGCVVAD